MHFYAALQSCISTLVVHYLLWKVCFLPLLIVRSRHANVKFIQITRPTLVYLFNDALLCMGKCIFMSDDCRTKARAINAMSYYIGLLLLKPT